MTNSQMEEIIEDVSIEKISPEKASKKIEEIEKSIDRLKTRTERIEAIALLNGNEGLKTLIEELQSIAEKATKNLEIKDLKSITKIIESAVLINEKIKFFKNEYDSKILGINAYNNLIEQIKERVF